MDAVWRLQESSAARVAQRLVWRTNRLRCMTHEEIGHRVLRGLAMQAERWGLLRAAAVPARDLESWFEDCPDAMGPNWSSALELGIRLINWSVAWQLLGGAASPLFRDARGLRFRRRWLDAVYQHAQFIHGHFSFYSSANNHL